MDGIFSPVALALAWRQVKVDPTLVDDHKVENISTDEALSKLRSLLIDAPATFFDAARTLDNAARSVGA